MGFLDLCSKSLWYARTVPLHFLQIGWPHIRVASKRCLCLSKMVFVVGQEAWTSWRPQHGFFFLLRGFFVHFSCPGNKVSAAAAEASQLHALPAFPTVSLMPSIKDASVSPSERSPSLPSFCSIIGAALLVLPHNGCCCSNKLDSCLPLPLSWRSGKRLNWRMI